jgi:hypothetical protein
MYAYTYVVYTRWIVKEKRIRYGFVVYRLGLSSRQREYCSFSAGDRGLRKTLLDNELCGWNAKDVTRSARRFALKLSDPRLADSPVSR